MSFQQLSDPVLSCALESRADQRMTLDVSENMTFVKDIASGGMSTISLYRTEEDGVPCDVAVKTICPRYVSNRDLRLLETEVNILRAVDHINIVRTYGIVEMECVYGLVLEYFPYGSYTDFFGSLLDMMPEPTEHDIFVSIVAPLKTRIIAEVIDAMEYLHRPRIFPYSSKELTVLHLDLKGENVLLDQQLHVKICDFGLSMMTTLTRLRGSEAKHREARGGTLGFIAPERLQDPHCTPSTKSDIYSFGILQYAILTDYSPYPGDLMQNFALFAHHVTESDFRPDVGIISPSYSKYLINMMQKCWSRLPADRPTFRELQIRVANYKASLPDFDQEASISATKVLLMRQQVYSNERLKPPLLTTELLQSSESLLTRHRQNISTSASFSSHLTSYETTIKRPSSRRGDDDRISTASETHELPREPAYTERPLCPLQFVMLGVGLTLCGLAVGAVIVLALLRSEGGQCQSLNKPEHGSVICAFPTINDTERCKFTCDTGYLISGNDTISCVGVKWTNTEPLCIKACEELPGIEYGNPVQCTNRRYESSQCSFSCNRNHVIQGANAITCLKSGYWSDRPPSCVCASCKYGKNCEHSVTWREVADDLENAKFGHSIQVNYGTHIFSCSIKLHIFKLIGICNDLRTATKAECNDGHGSRSDTAKAAAAELIRILSSQKIYPKPCDEYKMPTEC